MLLRLFWANEVGATCVCGSDLLRKVMEIATTVLQTSIQDTAVVQFGNAGRSLSRQLGAAPGGCGFSAPHHARSAELPTSSPATQLQRNALRVSPDYKSSLRYAEPATGLKRYGSVG